MSWRISDLFSSINFQISGTLSAISFPRHGQRTHRHIYTDKQLSCTI